MNLLGLTVLMAEVSNAEAARLNAQPALMYRVPAKDPFQTLFYMLPAVQFPDGKRYLKQGLFAPMPLLSDLERTRREKNGRNVRAPTSTSCRSPYTVAFQRPCFVFLCVASALFAPLR